MRQDESVERIQRCRPLGDASGPLRLTRSQAKALAQEFLEPVNDGSYTPTGMMSLNRFIEDMYLPFAEKETELSTYRDYKNKWLRYIKPRGEAALRDFKTLQGEQLLREIADGAKLSKTTLTHLKNFLSGVFRYAHRIGVLRGANPMREVKVPKGKAPAETHAYALEEIFRMLDLVPNPARTIIATAAFTGVSKGELRGLQIEDYGGAAVRIRQAVWRGHVKEPKNRFRKGSIPIITSLARLLDNYIAESGRSSGFLFASELGKPMNLDALVADVIRPALEKAGLTWHGWHAFRRGLATNLNKLDVPAKTIQQILRHANITTTMNIYVKADLQDAEAAMKKLESFCATIVQPHALPTGHAI